MSNFHASAFFCLILACGFSASTDKSVESQRHFSREYSARSESIYEIAYHGGSVSEAKEMRALAQYYESDRSHPNRLGRAPAPTFARSVASKKRLQRFQGQSLGPEDQEIASKLDDLMKARAELGEFSGAILVARNGNLILENAYGLANIELNVPNDIDTKFKIGSITKQFTAILVLQMVEKGLIDLNKTIFDYLPEYPSPQGKKITIHQLLSHTSGIPNFTARPQFSHSNHYSKRELMGIFASLPLDFEPGSSFTYSNSGYVVLGLILEKVSGKSYERLMHDNIFKPLNMNNTGIDEARRILKKRASGYDDIRTDRTNADYCDSTSCYATGDLYSTVGDLYKWDQALNTDQLLSKEYRDLMFKVEKNNYAYGWMRENFNYQGGTIKKVAFQHGGRLPGFTSSIHRFPEENSTIIILSNAMSSGLIVPLYKDIVAIINKQTYEIPKPLTNETRHQLIEMSSFYGPLHDQLSILDRNIEQNDNARLKELSKSSMIGLKYLERNIPRDQLLTYVSEGIGRKWVDDFKWFPIIIVNRLRQMKLIIDFMNAEQEGNYDLIKHEIDGVIAYLNAYNIQQGAEAKPSFKSTIYFTSKNGVLNESNIDRLSEAFGVPLDPAMIAKSAAEAMSLYRTTDPSNQCDNCIVVLDGALPEVTELAKQLRQSNRKVKLLVVANKSLNVQEYINLVINLTSPYGIVDDVITDPQSIIENSKLISLQTIPVSGFSLGKDYSPILNLNGPTIPIPSNNDIMERLEQRSLVLIDYQNLKQDFTKGEKSQEAELFLLTARNQKKYGHYVQVVIYNAKLDDPSLMPYHSLDNVVVTHVDAQASLLQYGGSYRGHVLHLSKRGINPFLEFTAGQREKIGFFRYQDKEIGVYGAALLYSEIGNNGFSFSRKDGYIYLASEVLDAIIKGYENTLVISRAA